MDETRASSRFCESCGSCLSRRANFCGQCGTAVDGDVGGSSRDRATSSGAVTELLQWAVRSRGSSGPRSTATPDQRARLRRRVRRHVEDGWRVEDRTDDSATLVRRSLGSTRTHLLIAAITVWWTMGLANAIYAAICYFDRTERTVLHADDSPSVDSPARERASPSARAGNEPTRRSRWLSTFVSLALLTLGLWVVASSASLGGFLVGALALGTGIVVSPPARSRLERRKPITTNGRTRSIEERSVHAPEKRCTGCLEPVVDGVERTYRQELVVAGVPIVTTNAGSNCYCDRCAYADPSAGSIRDALEMDDGFEADDELATEATEPDAEMKTS
ncbi:hypothetical protein ACFQO4_03595 [Saliphagus sp. GCM10025334]